MEITSLGLAYLVAAPTAGRVHILEALRHRHEDEWERIRLDIERAHREYKEFGYVVSRRASRGRLSGVGVPLQLGAQGIFTLSCLGVPSEFSRARVARTLGPTLVKAAHQLCETMASRAPQAPERAARKP
jgi:DNA-binding IclR family transcriptional regulator